MPRSLPHILLVLSAALSLPAGAQILLAGGTLPVCTSMTPTECLKSPVRDEQALTGHQFRIDRAGIARWRASLEAGPDSASLQAWASLLEQLEASAPEALSRAELTQRIRDYRDPNGSFSGDELYQAADDRSWWQLLDHFQEPLGERIEQVALENSRNPAALEVFRHFVAMAGAVSTHQRPRIAVSTASSRDPYDALAFYVQVFEQAGAEVVWLPLDRALVAARTQGRCEALGTYQAELLGSWDRQRVHPAAFAHQQAFCIDPERGLDLIDGIDGLFLNGGDQWLTLHAFLDPQGGHSAELRRLHERLQAGELVLGGTSAGAAVQSGPVMISNGGSIRALLNGAHEGPPPAPGCDRSGSCPPGLPVDALSFHRGGLGSFAPGIVDTHFSERWRQFRLLQLLAETGIRLGLGVDETSAVEVSGLFDDTHLRLRAIGASGGWLIDLDGADRRQALPLRLDGARLYHIGPGAQLKLEPAQVDPDVGDKAPSTIASGADCVDTQTYRSFAALAADRLPDAGHDPVCVRFDLDDETVASSRFEAVAAGASAQGAVRAWRWSLELVARP